jgi:uncharacterized protein
VRKPWFFAGVLGFGLMQLVAAAELRADAAAPRQISVTGQAHVDAPPDMATITLGVTNEAKEAAAAMDATSDSVRAILDRLQALGLEPRDLQTRRLSLNPVWSNRSGSTGAAPRIAGFVASNTVLVRVRDLDRLGAILDAVIDEGANDFNGLSFSLQDPEPLRDQARTLAVEDGIKRAAQLAQAAGVLLGPVLSISEHGNGRPAPMMMEMSARAADVPVAAGEVSASASVAMVFAIETGE